MLNWWRDGVGENVIENCQDLVDCQTPDDIFTRSDDCTHHYRRSGHGVPGSQPPGEGREPVLRTTGGSVEFLDYQSRRSAFGGIYTVGYT